jgi:hypothetical protein
VPIIRDTWHTQAQEWGFGTPIHPDWDADRVVEVVMTDLPYALFGGTGTYSRFLVDNGIPCPERRIWWFSSNYSFQGYKALADGYRVLFAHEFFHLMQWNVLLNTGSPEKLWLSWIEAQGRFVPTAQYPELELSREHLVMGNGHYVNSADRFLTQHLNTSYATLEMEHDLKYDAALYWRFLYEQYGGMDIIRAALEEMPHYFDRGPVEGMGSALDAAMLRANGRFSSFEESLVGFARANYALRLKNGRCVTDGGTTCEAFYHDPAELYVDPPLEAELNYAGAALIYPGAVPNSYGMDFVEVTMDPTVEGQPLAITFRGEGEAARFNIQIWKIHSRKEGPRAVTPEPDIVPQIADGSYVYIIPQVDTTAYDGLALIITRLDPDEAADPEANYQIMLGSAVVTDAS